MTDPTWLMQILVLLALIVGVPVARARWRGGTGWLQIGCALATWGLILLPLFFVAWSEDSFNDALQVTAVFAIFFGWIVVPLIAIFYQATNTPGWAFTVWRDRSPA